MLDLNKVALAMGKMLKMLTDVERSGTDFFSIDDNKEAYYALAYAARVGILDRIEENPYMQNPTLSITIPLGIFKTRKETMGSAMRMTIGKLLELCEEHDKVKNVVTDILERGNSFHEFENMFPKQILDKLR